MASLCSLHYVWTWVWAKDSLRGSLGLLGNPGTLWAPQVTKEETEAQGGWAGAGGTCLRSHSQPPGPQVSTSSILLSNSHAARGPGGGIKPTAQVAEGRPALASVSGRQERLLGTDELDRPAPVPGDSHSSASTEQDCGPVLPELLFFAGTAENAGSDVKFYNL